MACGGCLSRKRRFQAKLDEQKKAKELRDANGGKTPKELRIEARNARIAMRNARKGI